MALDIAREIAYLRSSPGGNWAARALQKIQDHANLPASSSTPVSSPSGVAFSNSPVVASAPGSRASFLSVTPIIAAGPGITITGIWPSINIALTPGVTVALPSQTASIPLTTILTPIADGLYVVSIQQMTATAGTAGTLRTVLGWTDSTGARTRVLATDLDLTNATDEEEGEMMVRVSANTPITYTTTLSGVTGSPAYNLFINVRPLL